MRCMKAGGAVAVRVLLLALDAWPRLAASLAADASMFKAHGWPRFSLSAEGVAMCYCPFYLSKHNILALQHPLACVSCVLHVHLPVHASDLPWRRAWGRAHARLRPWCKLKTLEDS